MCARAATMVVVDIETIWSRKADGADPALPFDHLVIQFNCDSMVLASLLSGCKVLVVSWLCVVRGKLLGFLALNASLEPDFAPAAPDQVIAIRRLGLPARSAGDVSVDV